MTTEPESRTASRKREPRKRPPIRNTDDLWCWMNTWGDVDKHDYTRLEKRAYEQAMSDLLVAMRKAGLKSSTVSNGAWARWTAG